MGNFQVCHLSLPGVPEFPGTIRQKHRVTKPMERSVTLKNPTYPEKASLVQNFPKVWWSCGDHMVIICDNRLRDTSPFWTQHTHRHIFRYNGPNLLRSICLGTMWVFYKPTTTCAPKHVIHPKTWESLGSKRIPTMRNQFKLASKP